MQKRLFAASAALLTALTIGLAGCSSDSGTTETAAEATASQGTAAVIATPAAPERVDVARFAEVVASPGVQIIDVRSPEEFAEGHIEGAVNYNVEGSDFATQIAGLDPAATYAVYCRSGNRSQVAVDVMAKAGIAGIFELQTGINDWAGAGQPVVQ
ncbi:MAG TPA: rhodanese-like domain-containing protein [Actinobacteria bacterium]|jgi:rhodanese-related sulfurtransferase|nr:rhodanese-like domain-containing protein [Actinomycetota bacterium]